MPNNIGASWVYAAYQEPKRRSCKASLAVGGAGLSELSVTDEERWIPFAKEVMFFEAAAELSKDDCSGRNLAPKIDLRKPGIVAYIGLAAKTLDDAIRNFLHYQRVHNLATRGELIEDGAHERSRVTYLQPELYDSKQRHEQGAGVNVHVGRRLSKRNIYLVEIRFIHKRDHHLNDIERVLGCATLKGQEVYETIFHRNHLSLPIPTAEHELVQV